MPTPSVSSPVRQETDNLKASLELNRRLAEFAKAVERGEVHTLEPLLPVLLTLKGQPYTLEEHFPFQPWFRTRMPWQMVCMAGRQVAKTTSEAANGVVLAASLPFFNTLYIAPLYEQVRRLSNNYVRPFIETSPVRALWTGTSTENSVLQRSFKSGSQMYFSFALLDAERVRGISCDRIFYDEVQDLDPDHIPVIREVLSHSKWELSWYAGTPKTVDNNIEALWKYSSMAEWCIRCRACGHINIPCLEHDILKMIGPMREDISPTNPATICAKCQRIIYPREGRWWHRKPELRWSFAGYHIPQVVMPIHYGSRRKWATLLGKQRGLGNTSPAKFKNEVLGESAAEGIKLVTERDLQAAAVLPWDNKPEDPSEALLRVGDYMLTCLAVDWGGGGDKEVSFTTMAVLGFRGSGGIDILWGRRLLDPSQHLAEAEECLRIFTMFGCAFIAHDYTGAGALRETFLIHAGVPVSRVIPIALCRSAAHDIITFHASTRIHPRDYWLLDKARSLQLTCQAIKSKYIRTFKYDYMNSDDPGLLRDFLALMENKVPTARAGDIYTIIRNPTLSDDFAQAINIGCCAIWHSMDAWPNLAELTGLRLSAAQATAAAPSPELAWREGGDLMGGFMGMP